MKKQIMKNKIVPRGTILLFLFLVLSPCILINSIKARSIYYPNLSAESNLLFDADSNVIYLNDEIDKQLTISGLTKIFNIYLVLEKIKNEKININQEISISQRAASIKTENESNRGVYFQVGQKITLNELIKLSIIYGDEGATIALAEWTNGDENKQIDAINKLIINNKLENTQIYNVTGMDYKGYGNLKPQRMKSEKNISSSRDIAIITNKLSKEYPTILNYSKMKNFSYNGYTYINANTLISDKNNNYPGVSGLISTATRDNHQSFVGIYQHEGHNYISVMLDINANDDAEDCFAQAIKLYDWINGMESAYIQLVNNEDLYISDNFFESGLGTLNLYPKYNIYSLKNTNINMVLKERIYNSKYFSKNKKLQKSIPNGTTVETLVYKLDNSLPNFDTIEKKNEFRIELVSKDTISPPNFFQKIPIGIEQMFWTIYDDIFK